jgi:HSP90 family molecular chaperone
MGGFSENQTLEINPQHELIILLNSTRKTNGKLASETLAQVLDNAMVQSGVFENPTPMIQRLNRLLTELLKSQHKQVESDKPQRD